VAFVPENGLYPLVTPDDRNVVFLSTRSGQQAPWIVSIEGGEPVPIIDAFAGVVGLDISADGQLL